MIADPARVGCSAGNKLAANVVRTRPSGRRDAETETGRHGHEPRQPVSLGPAVHPGGQNADYLQHSVLFVSHITQRDTVTGAALDKVMT